MIKNKILVALDFDHTIIDANSDTCINRLAPDGKIPDELKELYRKNGWTQYMREVFKYLHKNGISKDQLLDCVGSVSLSPGMEELFKGLPENKTEFIIISDSNILFITHILERYKLMSHFDTVFTNPAAFSEDGCLGIDMFHFQNYCSLSTVNLCKGKILHDYVEKKSSLGVNYDCIAYVGDGTNDFCPSLCLDKMDIVFPRVGFNLINHIKKMEEEKNLKIKAEIFPWSNGSQILEKLLSFYQKDSQEEFPSPRIMDPSVSN